MQPTPSHISRERRARGGVRGDERGFTLIELLVVILIIGILAAIAIPAFLGQRARAQDAQTKQLVRVGAGAAVDYVSDRTFAGDTNITAALKDAEPSLNTGQTTVARTIPNGQTNGWLVDIVSTTGVTYRIIHNWPGWTQPGASRHVCHPVGTGGCQKPPGANTLWTGFW